jgi:hypothetical protein
MIDQYNDFLAIGGGQSGNLKTSLTNKFKKHIEHNITRENVQKTAQVLCRIFFILLISVHT